MRNNNPSDPTVRGLPAAGKHSKAARKAVAAHADRLENGRGPALPEIVLFDHARARREKRKAQRRHWRDLREGRIDTDQNVERLDVMIVNLGDDPFGRTW